METFQSISNQIQIYLSGLDWSFISTFIVICYGVNHQRVRKSIAIATGKRTRTRYRVLIIGVLYAAMLYMLRGYDQSKIEHLFQSLVFALVFHKFIIEALMYWLAKKVLPPGISQHLLSENAIGKLNREADNA